MSKFKRIGLAGKYHSPDVAETWRLVIDFLLSEKVDIILEEKIATILQEYNLPSEHYGNIGKKCDLLVIMGGDGSLLDAARTIVADDVPVVGINRGKLGFLTDICPSEIAEKLHAILQGEYTTEKRFILEASTSKEQCTALNEIILSAGNTEHMIEFETYVNDRFVCSQRSNGVIITTPTGSTAYCLSAGGPILHPTLDAVAIIPMFAHTLTSRPIVLDGNSHISIKLSKYTDVRVFLSGDCHSQTTVPANEIIQIKKHDKALSLIHPMDYDYFEVLRSKLYWGKKLPTQMP